MAVHHPLAGAALRASRWSAAHPWRAILGWLALVCVAVGLSMAIPTQGTKDADYRIGDSGRAEQLVDRAGLAGAPTEDVLITSRGGAAIDPAQAMAAATSLAADARQASGVTEVATPQWNPDRSALLVDIELTANAHDVSELQAITRAAQRANPDIAIRQTGEVSLDKGINDQVGRDLSSAEGISLPITLILMLLAFGALIAAGLPVLLAASSVAATIGITAPLSHLVHADDTVSSMIVLIGMAVGVDYSLFYLKREREERANGHSTLDAVEIAAETSGHSIIVSGLAVIASMAALLVVGDTTFNSLACGAILVVAIAVLGSITVLPALLVRLGRWVDRPRVPLLWRVNNRIGRGGISRRILGPVLRRPVAALVLGGILVGAVAIPAFGMRIHEGNLDTLPTRIPEVKTIKTMAEKYPSRGVGVTVVVKASPTQRSEVRAALRALDTDAIGTTDFVRGEDRPIRTSTDGGTSVLTLVTAYDESDPKMGTAVEHLRQRLAPRALDDLGSGAEYVVGGEAAGSVDSSERLSNRLPIVIAVVLVLTMLMMGFAFRSVPIALLTTILNLASVGVSFGMLTLVFQHGWLHGALGFSTPGFVIDWLPLFVLVVLVGLSMDYHVFVLSRIREHVRRGLPARLAVEEGIRDTAGVVTSAAAVMVSVFAIFATLSMLEMKMMGVGLSAAILVDATLIRLVLLPAILVLLGDRAWWPRRPGRPVGRAVVEDEPAYELATR